jgi:hypothetical protein
MLQAITRRLKRGKRGISTVIVVMLSLVLIVIIVGNVVLWSYQMNQLDWEKMREDIAIVNATSLRNVWSCNPSQYVLKGSTSWLSGSLSNLTSDDGVYITFRSYYSGTDTSDFVNTNVTNVDSFADRGTHSNFDNQKAKDNDYDTLKEVNTGVSTKYYPSNANRLGYTQLVSGSVTDLQSNNGVYMTFRSYPSQNSSGIFGNTNTGSDYYSIENTIVGSFFTATENGWADNITAYLQITGNPKNVKCAIYKQSDLSLVAYTQERLISSSYGPNWETFSFSDPKPSLTAGTQYILVAWASSSGSYYGDDARFYRQNGAVDQAYYDDIAYGPTWPNPLVVDAHGARNYCIYCSYTKPIEYTIEVEFTGTSNTQSWSRLNWTIDNSYTTSGVTATFQLYNYQSGTYPTSGDGYNSTTIGTTDVTVSQAITANPTYFRDGSGNWKLKLLAKKATDTAFDCRVDLVQYEAGSDNYELDLEEQWTNAHYDEANEYLCVYTGSLSPENPKENLNVDVWNGSAWTTLMTLSSADSNMWKNASVSSYLTSSTFTIRFKGGNETGDTVQHSWNIDATLLHVWSNEYIAEVEFIGSSNTENWNQLNWTINSAWTTSSVNVTLQLYNYTLGGYPTSGNGYIAYTSDSTPNTDKSKNQTINVNPTDFRNSTGYWKVKVKGVKADAAPFDFKADLIEFKAVKGEETLFTVRNEGALTLHIVSLWINNSTQHQRYDVNIFINSGETTSLTYGDITLPDKPYDIKIITERGNAAVFASD